MTLRAVKFALYHLPTHLHIMKLSFKKRFEMLLMHAYYVDMRHRGQLRPQNIRREGIATTIIHSHDNDTASPL